jgi:hypothetical protein
MIDLQNLLETYREAAQTEREKGTYFLYPTNKLIL